MSEKIKKTWRRKVTYSKEHWDLLREKRKKATRILEVLEKEGIKGFVYGSVARGDCREGSDIDIIIFSPSSPFLLEHTLKTEFNIYDKEISQATPKLAIKGHLWLDPKTTLTFPFTKLSEAEREFYEYGGKITIPRVRDSKKRETGIDKRLVLIQPTEKGHREFAIIGREEKAAKMAGVSGGFVLRRESILRRRDRKGRSGPFIRQQLGKEESFDDALRRIAAKNPYMREKLKEEA